MNRSSLVQMNDARGTPAALAPWHLWLVGVLWLVYSDNGGSHRALLIRVGG